MRGHIKPLEYYVQYHAYCTPHMHLSLNHECNSYKYIGYIIIIVSTMRCFGGKGTRVSMQACFAVGIVAES